MVRPASCQRRAGLALLAGPSGRLGLLRTTGLFGEDEPVSADGANPGDDPDVPDGAAVAGADAPIGGGTWPVGDAGPVLGAAVAGGAVAGGAVAGGALVGGTATDGAATDGAATDGAATDRAAATGGEAAGGTATRGTATRGVVMGSAVTGGAVMGGSAATAAAAAISAADVARSKLAAEAASDVGDGAPASQLADGGSALGRAVAGGALTGVVVAAGWARVVGGRSGLASRVGTPDGHRSAGRRRRLDRAGTRGALWQRTARPRRLGWPLVARMRLPCGGGPARGQETAANLPRRQPVRARHSPWQFGRLVLRRRTAVLCHAAHPPAAIRAPCSNSDSAAQEGLPYNRNRPFSRNKRGQRLGSCGSMVSANP